MRESLRLAGESACPTTARWDRRFRLSTLGYCRRACALFRARTSAAQAPGCGREPPRRATVAHGWIEKRGL